MHWKSSSGFRSLVMELVLGEGKERELGHQWGAYDSRPADGGWLQVVKVQRSGPQSTSTLWNATQLPVEDQVSPLQDSLSLQPCPLHRGTCNQCLVDAEIQRPSPLALMGAEELSQLQSSAAASVAATSQPSVSLGPLSLPSLPRR